MSVLSSPGELRQVIANLIGNSIDAMRHTGKLRIRVSCTGARSGSCVRLTIGDTGSGIAKDLLPRIFEPFVTTKEETGTGLGLWVTGEIVKRNGWALTVRSSQQAGRHGTVFTLHMPAV